MAGPYSLFLLILTALCSGIRAHKCSLSNQNRFCPDTRLYAYDDTVGECKLQNSLCPETTNTFSSLRDCEAKCIESGAPAQCLLPKLIGPCHHQFQRFYYNSISSACEGFVYGGCGGNANNFATIEECGKACKVSTSAKSRARRSTANATRTDDRKPGNLTLQSPTKTRKPIGLHSNARGPILAKGYKANPSGLHSNANQPAPSILANGYKANPTGLSSNAGGPAPSILANGYKANPTGLHSNANQPAPSNGYKANPTGSNANQPAPSILANGYKASPTGLHSNANQPAPPILANGYKANPTGLHSNASGPAPPILGNGYKANPTGLPSNASRPAPPILANGYKANPTGLHSNANQPAPPILANGYKANPTGLHSNANQPAPSNGYKANPTGLHSNANQPAPSNGYKANPNGLPSNASGPSILADGHKVNPTGLPSNGRGSTSYIPVGGYKAKSPINTANITSETAKLNSAGNTFAGSLGVKPHKKQRIIDDESTLYGQGSSNFNLTRKNAETDPTNVCLLPSEHGPCDLDRARYYYSQERKACRLFLYGGCNGNKNNFETIEGCVSRCEPDRCAHPVQVGLCDQQFRRYFYDSKTNSCLPFTYSGCGGNSNNFPSFMSCRRACGTQNHNQTLAKGSTAYSVCELRPEEKECAHSQRRLHFYYNSSTGRCMNFETGKCGSDNGNSFPSLNECEKKCGVNVCQVPHLPTPCGAVNDGDLYYDLETDTCKPFAKGMCGANLNSFSDFRQCENKCVKDVCRFTNDSGECFAYFPKYYYDSKDGQCHRFIYGGCGGNPNRFDTIEACQYRCQPSMKKSNSTLGNNNGSSTGVPGDADPVNTCSLPPVTGPCRAGHHRYYYNTTLGKCTKFIYGGCNGNANNFITMKHCQETCLNDTVSVNGTVNTCSLPPVTGPCRAGHHRYYYNSTLGKCTKFIYGGCNGNANNFITIKHCQATCLNDTVSVNGTINTCSLPPVTGPCRAGHHRYYYNSTLGKCTKFIYGGCKGNANNFITIKHCQETCLNDTVSVNGNVNTCSLPPVTGPCMASYHRYYYNSTLGKCTKFIYGGCKGNANNFVTTERCEETCVKDPCDQPRKVGPCKARLERFYFNSTTGKCVPFYYGGCDANANNFKTAGECQNRCAIKDPCSLRPDAGTCNHTQTCFYFDLAAGHCLNFTYSGCGGNANRFLSASQCGKTCIRNRCEKEMNPGGCDKNLTRFFHDYKRGQCVPFVYGGCGGNANNFQSAKLCKDACLNENPCLQPKMRGPCLGIFKRFHYDPVERKCLEFDYGGCQGNKNNFQSLLKCQTTCVIAGPKRISKCHLPKDQGKCSSSEERFYYNSTLTSCEPFTYKGCAGNANNFLSEGQCERECKFDPCKQPKIVGDCSRFEKRWYFDETSQRCQTFNYSGCGGNYNNFKLLDNCERRCVQPACRLDAAAGSCNQSLSRFYYNWKQGRCVRFNYTGCHGNENRFPSMKHCQVTCSVDPCLQPLYNVGHCFGAAHRYFYDRTTGFCQGYISRGCQTNGNSFVSAKECHKACQHMYTTDRKLW